MAAVLTLLALSLVVFLTALVFGMYSISLKMRAEYPALWHTLAEPDAGLSTEAPAHRHILTFLDSRRYLETHDARLIALCNRVRGGLYVFLGLFGFILVVGAAYVAFAI